MGSARHFTPVILVASAVYAVLAVVAFVLILGPSGYEYRGHVDEATWASAALAALFVVVPYAILYAAYRRAIDSRSRVTVATITIVVAAVGAFIYFFSFQPNDGEYGLAYVVVPLIQLPFAIAGLLVSLRRRKRRPHAA